MKGTCSVLQKQGWRETHHLKKNCVNKQSDKLRKTFLNWGFHHLQSIISSTDSENPEKSLHVKSEDKNRYCDLRSLRASHEKNQNGSMKIILKNLNQHHSHTLKLRLFYLVNYCSVLSDICCHFISCSNLSGIGVALVNESSRSSGKR